MLACFDDRDGHDFHIAGPNELKLAWQKHREHAAEKKRQIQLPVGTAPGHLDGAVAIVVEQQREGFTRSLHRREKRFRGPGRHQQGIGPDQHLGKAQNAGDTNAETAANLAARA